MIRFHNTLSGGVEPFAPLAPGRVGLYTCGPTVYNYPHIGNYRAYVFEDLLKRFLIFAGFKVTHVMNITDVDDKTILGAERRGQTLREYTQVYTKAFFEDSAILQIMPADVYPRATEHIPEMTALIRGLLDKGYAYYKDGSVYFSIAKFPAYGRLSKIHLDDLEPGRRSDADEYEKENVHAFALWKAPKEGDPFWETDLAPGRPGWHIECSAMSSKYLGETFDIHCGGVDNIFPHHENEIAQSEAFTGKTFVRTWMHCHHLVVDGEKMSKSKGNQYTLRDLVAAGVDPLDLRFLLLSTHYRKMLNYTSDALAQAAASRRRLLDFLYELEHRAFPPPATRTGIGGLLERAREGFTAGLSDDLNISESLSALFELVREANTLVASGKLDAKDAGDAAAFVRGLDDVLAILPPKAEETLPAEISSKIEARQKARRDRDFALADRLRDEIL
ncbi:MAG TPA: cysteine--tRNA ligase, partial [Acidobacteriota bacterium]|nr:cysteine--tRNA ligase [Acidobacteriota bacterium]